MDDRIKKIADHYGIKLQSIQLIQELGELVEAVTKYILKGDTEFNHLSEEIADVEIMIEQVKYLMNNYCFVELWKEKKLERQLDRIKDENEPEKLVTVIGGIHGIHYGREYKTYYWKVDCDETFTLGDLAVVHTKNGIERVLVMEIKEVPKSEAAKYNTTVAKVVFNDGKQQG